MFNFFRPSAALVAVTALFASTACALGGGGGGSGHTAEYRSLNARTVWSPPITEPSAHTVWKVGAQETIRWDTSNAPADPTSSTATIYLGFFKAQGEGGENLDTEHPLATDVDLSLGEYTITVPSVKPRHSYIIALVGDSGNISPEFTITH